jgi:NAD(P)-dependent dehydrogenase (short-subunit alcohol dehydrogenase family)
VRADVLYRHQVDSIGVGVAVVSGGGRGLGRAFCLALARQGASVVVNNRNRVVDGDGLGPADHVAAEITALGQGALTNMLLPYALTQMTADYVSRTSGFFPWPPSRRPGPG